MSFSSQGMTRNGGLGAALSIRNLTKRYGHNAPAVDDVSLDIQAGEFVTFLGPSGSGKTTTLSMVAGFTDVTSGQILLGGQPIEALPPHRRNIGMVFQSYSLFPHMTVFDNVAFPLRRRGIGKAEIRSRVGRVLELIQLADKMDRYPTALSGGQQQRVALARAIVFEPTLLLMDEPLSALDKKLREQMQLEIRRLHKELKITFIFVTHDQEEALVMSDRIAVFRNGKLAQVGTAADLYERPQSLFVANFLGDSNILHGTARVEQDSHILENRCGKFMAPRSQKLDGSTAAAISVRPERMRVIPVAQECGEPNRVNARVSQIIYVGSSRKVEVALSDGTLMQIREQPRDQIDVREGAEVAVCWPISASTMLPDEKGGAGD
ncbi:Spermidine/putrescine import ATP-binding protein PotA [Paraburkholderia sediminicola]|uniref:Spermidine/putrescine import ATP-binding protein PotA n=1 Tax=Paraburkholderia sediminicola TaxID=458836 RepID=A0A6J5CTX6_9BURK|nr:ABC transporter ATP-binding protein [Paraburkholderia sediminicola]CAB3745583.1 Spermidine/putrescine import ATP-binding protein PotA [Paraburkholderia sediminicola]